MNILKWCKFVKSSLPARHLSTSVSQSNEVFVENLSSQRSLVRVSGDQVDGFLQGLITNDINHVAKMNANSSMFTMFLNKPGRVLYDAIIYKRKNTENLYFIECDRTIDEQLKQHLQLFRVRKKIDIDIVRDEFNVWAAFQKNENSSDLKQSNRKETDEQTNETKQMTTYSDPRLNLLGTRILVSANLINVDDFRSLWPIKDCVLSTDSYNYTEHRYGLGVSEGIVEIASGKSFPFEANCDYLHGISFYKGCYLGQEFTARTYHTGVIRKRLMSIHVNAECISSGDASWTYDAPIVNEDNQPVGKLKGLRNKHAIGVLKTELALKSKLLKFANIAGTTHRPIWWPQHKARPDV